MAFLVLLILGLIIASLLLWRRCSRHKRSKALAEDYIQNGSGVLGVSDDKFDRLRRGSLLWKHAFAPPVGGHQRSLRRVMLVGSEKLMVSSREAHRATHVQRPFSTTDISIPVREILALELGPPDRLENKHGTERRDLCFRLLTKKRSYEFEALTNDDFCCWVLGLQELLSEQQRWAGLPHYDETQLAEAQKDMVRGFALPAAFDFSLKPDELRWQDDKQMIRQADYRAPQVDRYDQYDQRVVEIDAQGQPPVWTGGNVTNTGAEEIVELDCR